MIRHQHDSGGQRGGDRRKILPVDVDAVLARVTDKTTQVIGGEQDDLIATGAAVEEEERIRLSTSRLRFTVLTPEPTVPTSLIAHPIQSAGDCN